MQHQNRGAPERNTDPEHKPQEVRTEELHRAVRCPSETERQAQQADDQGTPLEAVQTGLDRFSRVHLACSVKCSLSCGGTSSSVACWLNWSARM